MSSEDSMANAGISPRERLQRIEDLLNLVLTRLDTKADDAYVATLDLRLKTAELQLAEERVLKIERAADANRFEQRLSTLESDINAVGRKLAYATGTLSVVVVVVNFAVPYIINH